jgi:hypothetical protein
MQTNTNGTPNSIVNNVSQVFFVAAEGPAA